MNGERKCPFCGGDPYLETKWDAAKCVTFMFVKCKKCGASGKAYATEKRIIEHDDIYNDIDLMKTAFLAIEAWNWRAKE